MPLKNRNTYVVMEYDYLFKNRRDDHSLFPPIFCLWPHKSIFRFVAFYGGLCVGLNTYVGSALDLGRVGNCSSHESLEPLANEPGRVIFACQLNKKIQIGFG